MIETDVQAAPESLKKQEEISDYTEKRHDSPALDTLRALGNPHQVSVRKAVVKSTKGKEAIIKLEASATLHLAKVSFSCLIAPEPGDIVLSMADETGTFYILSIIERLEGKDTATLSLPENTVLNSPGSISLMAGKVVNLISSEQLNCISTKALHKSRETLIQSEEITAKGQQLSGYFQKLNLVSTFVHTFSERFIRKTISYIRKTDSDDQVSAKQMIRHAEGLYSLKADVTMMKSDKDTFIDGDHVFTSL